MTKEVHKYLEDRKLKEIEHSDHRRSIVRAYEYHTDASSDRLKENYVERENEFNNNFSNMKQITLIS